MKDDNVKVYRDNLSTFEVTKEQQGTLRSIFNGYIFRREENGKFFVKCSTKKEEELLKLWLNGDINDKELFEKLWF